MNIGKLVGKASVQTPKDYSQKEFGNPSLNKAARDLLCTFAVETWRLRRKLGQLTDADQTAMRDSIDASLGRMETALRELGVQCVEHTDQRYDPGLELIAHWESDASLDAGVEIISNTVVPSVMMDGHLIKPGEVVVSTGKTQEVSSDEQ